MAKFYFIIGHQASKTLTQWSIRTNLYQSNLWIYCPGTFFENWFFSSLQFIGPIESASQPSLKPRKNETSEVVHSHISLKTITVNRVQIKRKGWALSTGYIYFCKVNSNAYIWLANSMMGLSVDFEHWKL